MRTRSPIGQEWLRKIVSPLSFRISISAPILARNAQPQQRGHRRRASRGRASRGGHPALCRSRSPARRRRCSRLKSFAASALGTISPRPSCLWPRRSADNSKNGRMTEDDYLAFKEGETPEADRGNPTKGLRGWATLDRALSGRSLYGAKLCVSSLPIVRRSDTFSALQLGKAFWPPVGYATALAKDPCQKYPSIGRFPFMAR